MSFKDSMLRGLALYGSSRMAGTMGFSNKEMNNTIIKIAQDR
ncbi:hypothetical protein [Bifidobacterium pluvialisilvae]|nr:hypothetical protein [Bifidobacterium pluvialisilvae]